MKLASIKSKITQNMAVSGLLKGAIEYEIKQGTSQVEWTGPVIQPGVWHQILAFFKAVYELTKSECQVRLYVNTTSKLWAAWAYPQEAKTGMTAKEIANEIATKQREQFKDSDGWVYLGTVHHHCACSAFQSGTDKDNERSQDGLHITVGKLDEKQYDIHARFYLDGTEFIPDMSAFWDIGDQARALLPTAVHDTVARHQMTQPAPADTKYPDEWKDNLIEIKPTFYQGNVSAGASVPISTIGASGGANTGGHVAKDWDGLSEVKRKELALAMVKRSAKHAKVDTKSMDTIFAFLSGDACVKLIREAAIAHRLSVFDIVQEWEWEQNMADQLAHNQDGGYWQ